MFISLARKLLKPIILHNYEDVIAFGPEGEKTIRAKIDTGANLTSIDKSEAENLGLLRPENIIEQRFFESGLGKEHRDIIKIEFQLKGKKIKTIASVSNRSHMAHKMIIGRQNLSDFLVQPSTIQEDKK